MSQFKIIMCTGIHTASNGAEYIVTKIAPSDAIGQSIIQMAKPVVVFSNKYPGLFLELRDVLNGNKSLSDIIITAEIIQFDGYFRLN